jgi:hypothetical protein
MINTFISGYRKSRAEPQFVTGDAVAAELLCVRSPDGSAEDQAVRRLLDPEVIAVLRELPLYCCLFGETAAVVRPAAAHRVRAMDLSDQWVREGCRTDSPLLPLRRAALVRASAALLTAVHHEES